MARESALYEMDLQQTIALYVYPSNALLDTSTITDCAIEAVDHSDDSVETWPSSVSTATEEKATIHVLPPPSSIVAGRRYTVRGTVSVGATQYPLTPCGLTAREWRV